MERRTLEDRPVRYGGNLTERVAPAAKPAPRPVRVRASFVRVRSREDRDSSPGPPSA